MVLQPSRVTEQLDVHFTLDLFLDLGSPWSAELFLDLLEEVGLGPLDPDTRPPEHDDVLSGAGVHAGTTEHAVVLVYRDGRLHHTLHIMGGLRGRQVNCIAGTDIRTGGTSAGALFRVELDVAFEDLLDGDSLGRTVPGAPRAGAAGLLVDIDAPVHLVGDDLPFDGYALDGTHLDTDLAGIAFRFIPDDLAFNLAGFRGECLVPDLDSRADGTAESTEGALFIVDLEGGLALQGELAFLAILNRSLERGDIPVYCVPWADLLAYGAAGALFIVDVRYHVILGESFLFEDGEPLFAVDLEGQGVEGAHDDTDTTVAALLLVNVDRRRLLESTPADCTHETQ